MERHLRKFDRLGDDLRVIARSALADEKVNRLMTIAGIDMVVGRALMAAIGDIERFPGREKLVGYLGLNPSVRQSGPGTAYHGRITKQRARTRARHAGRGRLGRGTRPGARCAASFCGCRPDADSTSLPPRRRANSPP